MQQDLNIFTQIQEKEDDHQPFSIDNLVKRQNGRLHIQTFDINQYQKQNFESEQIPSPHDLSEMSFNNDKILIQKQQQIQELQNLSEVKQEQIKKLEKDTLLEHQIQIGYESIIEKQDQLSEINKRISINNNTNMNENAYLTHNEPIAKQNEKSQSRQSKNLSQNRKNQEYQINKQTQDSQMKNKIHQLKLFNLLGYVNKFKYAMKKITIFLNPQKLYKNQLTLLNDLSSQGPEEGWGSENIEVNFVQSQKDMSLMEKFNLRLQKKFNQIKRGRNFIYVKKLLLKIDSAIPIFNSHLNIIQLVDVLINIVSIFLLIFIPFNSCFKVQKPQFVIMLVNSIFPFIYIFQSLIESNTSFYESGMPVKERVLILKHFIKNRLFSDTFLVIMLFLEFDEQKLSSCLLFVFAAKKFAEKQESMAFIKNKIQNNINLRSIRDLMVLFTKIMYFNHFFACITHLVAQNEVDQGHNSWLIKNDLVNSTLYQQYISSFYFVTITMCTVGFGDITPQSDNERICLSIITLISSGIYGYTLTSIGNILMQLSRRQKEHKISLAELDLYLKQHDVDEQLQDQARQYIQFAHQSFNKQNEEPGKCLNSLSLNIREDILKNIFLCKIKKIPFFSKHFSASFLQQLATKGQEKVICPGEILFKNKKNFKPTIIILVKGKLELFSTQESGGQIKYATIKQPETIIKTLNVGEVYGQYEFFLNISQSSLSVRSSEFSTIFYFQLEDFKSVLDQFPLDQETFYDIRDQCTYNQQFQLIQVNCLSCYSSNHIINKCPYLVFGGDKYDTFKNMNIKDTDFRKMYKRPVLQKQRTDFSLIQEEG